jgi:glyoxylase-like metal-dependent hydrolase (beta-lactamase superfamily II)
MDPFRAWSRHATQGGIVHLTEHIALIGSGQVGFNLTHPLDCHVYLVHDGDDAVMIDAGAGVDIAPILTEIDRSGVPRDAIRRLLLTHAHGDHAGGTRALRDALDLEVFATPLAAQYVHDGDEAKTSLDRAKGPGGYPEGYIFQPCPMAGELHEGDRLPVGSLEIEVIETPGHCGGHLSYLLHRPGGTDLLCGDALFWGGTILLQDIWDCSVSESCASVRKLDALKVDGLYPGHAAVAIQRGWTHAWAAMENISKMLPPPQFL